MTVTDPMNRLVTGLEKENFHLRQQHRPDDQVLFQRGCAAHHRHRFRPQRQHVVEVCAARKALTEFLRTSNPQDEFFVVGFNDRPAVIVDYTSDPDDVEARMVMLKPENRTALIDAVYLGIDHLRHAKYERKALLIISDGGDNRSRYTEGELRRVVRESDVQIYSIGIFDNYAPTHEEAARAGAAERDLRDDRRTTVQSGRRYGRPRRTLRPASPPNCATSTSSDTRRPT